MVEAGPAISVASGILFALLGLALLLPRPRRERSVTFGLFSILWGAVIVFGNLSRLVRDDALARRLTLLYLAAFCVVYVPLLYFTAVIPSRRGLVARSRLAAAVLLAPAALGALALAFFPGLLLAGFRGSGVSRQDVWGPLFPFFGVLFFASFLWAVLKLDHERRLAKKRLEERRLALVLPAFLLYVGFVSAQNVVRYHPLDQAWDGLVVFFSAVAGLILVAVVGLRILAKRGTAHRGILLAATATALTLGLVSGLSRAGILFPFPVEALGILRTASVVLIAYAILRFELFDIEVKVKRGALVAAVLVGAAVVAIVVEQALERVLGSTGLAITVTQFALFGGVVVAVMKAPQAARALGERVLPQLHAPERLDARRLEVYEAALSQAMASGGLDAQADFLADLRRRLGVSEGEHALLARLLAGTGRSAEARFEPGGMIASRYQLKELLGEGTSGAAWLARDATLERRVVLKALHQRVARTEAASRAFLREARLVASLDHPNVVRVYDFGTNGEVPYVVMEHVDGGSLDDLLARAGALPPSDAERIVRQVLDGLAHVHARGVLHRDLKPANVLLTADGTAKIADFGIALAEDPDATQGGLELPAPRGTPATMSPEAVRGIPPTPASDVYSVGAVLYQLVSGQTYLSFTGRTRADIHRAILEDPPRTAPQGTDERLLAVALRALAKDPARRYPSAEAMRAALETRTVALAR